MGARKLHLAEESVPEERPPTRPTGGRALVLAIRVMLLLVAAGAATIAVAVGNAPGGASHVRYICPMHPDVITAAPGECPVCRMALEPMRPGSPAVASSRGDMAGDANWRAVENVRRHDVVDVARMRSLLFDLREMRGPAWIEPDGTVSAIFYNDQVLVLDADEMGTFTPAAEPKATVAVSRSPEASAAWDASTSRVRFVVRSAGAAKAPPAGTVGWIELARKQRQVLTVPVSAVLQSSTGPYVLLMTEGFHFKKQPIEIGETLAGLGVLVVLSGLRSGDRVISRATFFLDADRRQNAQMEDGIR
jgi:hypothetical protein